VLLNWVRGEAFLCPSQVRLLILCKQLKKCLFFWVTVVIFHVVIGTVTNSAVLFSWRCKVELLCQCFFCPALKK